MSKYRWLLSSIGPVWVLLAFIVMAIALHGCTSVPVTQSTYCTDYTRVTLTKDQWKQLPDTAAQQILANERFYRNHCK